jgi:ribose transport system permease protein
MSEKENTSRVQGSTLAASRGTQKMTASALLMKYNAIIILVILFIIASFVNPLFVTPTNLFTVLRQQVPYLIIAMGMLIVIITAGIDLSVSAVAGVSSILVAHSMIYWGLSGGGMQTWAAVLLGVAVGGLFGVINGALVAKLNMPAFIVTLATMTAAEGIGYIITKGNTLMLDSKSAGYAELVGFSTKTIGAVPIAVIFAAVIVIIFFFVMKYTTFGRMVYAVGSNEAAVQLAGINSKKYLFFVYLIAGFLCGIAGVIITSRSGNASALTAGVDYNMTTIAGVVIGGASLAGGEGTVIMTVVGVFIMAIIGNIMNLANVASYPQMVVKAIVIILAVLLKSVSSKKHA